MKRVHRIGTWAVPSRVSELESIHVEKPENNPDPFGDHIYKMDYQHMLAWHRRNQADIQWRLSRFPPGQLPIRCREYRQRYRIMV